jgi:hypothetical protein
MLSAYRAQGKRAGASDPSDAARDAGAALAKQYPRPPNPSWWATRAAPEASSNRGARQVRVLSTEFPAGDTLAVAAEGLLLGRNGVPSTWSRLHIYPGHPLCLSAERHEHLVVRNSESEYPHVVTKAGDFRAFERAPAEVWAVTDNIFLLELTHPPKLRVVACRQDGTLVGVDQGPEVADRLAAARVLFDVAFRTYLCAVGNQPFGLNLDAAGHATVQEVQPPAAFAKSQFVGAVAMRRSANDFVAEYRGFAGADVRSHLCHMRLDEGAWTAICSLDVGPSEDPRPYLTVSPEDCIVRSSGSRLHAVSCADGPWRALQREPGLSPRRWGQPYLCAAEHVATYPLLATGQRALQIFALGGDGLTAAESPPLETDLVWNELLPLSPDEFVVPCSSGVMQILFEPLSA